MHRFPFRRLLVGTSTAALAVVLVVLLALPLGPLPALGPTFNPVTGVFAGIDRDPASTLTVPGVQQPVIINEDAYGVPHIFAQTDHDLFFAEGYITARHRLTELDLIRRQAEGRLAEIVGPAALPSDERERVLGLARTAQAAAARLPQVDPEAAAELDAYAAGINAWIDEAIRTHALPPFFRLLGYTPEHWQVADSLAIQGIMTQELAFSTAPIDRANLADALGQDAAATLFPQLPQNPQLPYAPGPYPAITPDQAALDAALLPYGNGAGTGGRQPSSADAPPPPSRATSLPPSRTVDRLIQSMPWLVDPLGLLVRPQLTEGNSNNWAVGGGLTDTGKPYLAGDPHLGLTLPAIWIEVHLESPTIHVYGVSIPGTPGIIIGHNRTVAWSLTNTQNAQTVFYREQTSPDHPGQYFYAGQWRPFVDHDETILVRGQPAHHLTVHWTVHGPVIPEGLAGIPPLNGRTLAMAWTGNLFSDDVGALLRLMQARTADDVRAALARWGAPTQNFAYATTDGAIGIIAAGYYPLLAHGQLDTLLDGSDPQQNWQGLIPASAVPQVQGKPNQFVWSANQRPVSADYPVDIGSALGFDAGYRASVIYAFLNDPANRPLTRDRLMALQASHQDALARRMLPVVVQALVQDTTLSPLAQQALALLRQWNGTMAANQAAPAIWWHFLQSFIVQLFGPWWAQAGLDQTTYTLHTFTPHQDGWDGNLVVAAEVLTTGNPADRAQSLQRWLADPSTGQPRPLPTLFHNALESAVNDLAQRLGANPASWQWGAIHRRLIPSLTQAPRLARGPYPTDGDSFTVDPSGGESSTGGASWRMIADLADLTRSVGVFPAGESEDPTSPHYDDQLPLWLNHQVKPLYFPETPQAAPGGWVVRVWQLRPKGAS
ncbi:MAG: penicillin acylase family protein [Thermorudis peleae]|nr:penicillin acylase family protein [Thermorudis peleae]